MVHRTMTIHDELDIWINNFRAKMLEYQRQNVPYATALNLVGRLGSLILSQPDKLTDEQKTIIKEFIEEANTYRPQYARVEWSDKYLQHMVPKILDEIVKEPWKLDKLQKEVLKQSQPWDKGMYDKS